MGVAAGFTGSDIGTDEANEKNEEQLQAPEPPVEDSPEEPEATEADLAAKAELAAKADALDAEEHADVRLHDQGEDTATSGVEEEGSVEYGA